jgi:hypothetical protein
MFLWITPARVAAFLRIAAEMFKIARPEVADAKFDRAARLIPDTGS